MWFLRKHFQIMKLVIYYCIINKYILQKYTEFWQIIIDVNSLRKEHKLKKFNYQTRYL